LLLAAALGACAFLPWFGDVAAVRIPLGSLLDASANSGGQAVSSVGLLILIAAVILVLSAIASSRVLLIGGALLGFGVSAAWILVRLIDGLGVVRIGAGAYGAVLCCLMALILAAVATDTRVPTVR
jgi:hypothetical protein